MTFDPYLGGFIDCALCIEIQHRPPSRKRRDQSKNFEEWVLRAHARAPHRGILDSFAARWGGKVRRPRLAHHQWEWRITANQAAAFLSEVQPHIRLKSAQVETALAFQNTFTTKYGCLGVPDDVRQFRAKCCAELQVAP